MAITDIVCLLLLTVMSANGAFQGFLRALVKPLALLLSMAITWTWYLHTHHFISTCLISISGPFVIGWLMNLGIKRWQDNNPHHEIAVLSRLGGAAIGLIGGTILAVIVVTMLSLLPLNKFELANVGKDVVSSGTFAITSPLLARWGILPAAAKTPCPADANGCTVDEDLLSDKELQELARHPLILKLLNDPEAVDAIQAKDMGRILSNPVITELQSNPELLMKIMRLYPKIQKKLNAQNAASSAGQGSAAP